MTYNTIDNDVTMAGGAEGALGRIDKYELRRELGEGGFGTVYLAHDTVADVDVAVKGLPPEVKHNAAELESIRGNFALVKRLRHPNIVAVTDLHQALSVSYASKEVESKLRVFGRDTMVVMDYAPGVTLAQWRRQFPGGKVPLDKAIAVVRQVASALDYAHAQKVLHRDVKPANVMVESADAGKLVARVLDFGLAAEIRSSMGRLSREIRDTSGTRPYMAPEQWKGERQGPATDQYALAAMFYELVVGDVPFSSVFDCGDPGVMSVAVTTNAPTIAEDLPKCVRKALAVALAKKPEERFTTCGEFVAALEGKKVSRRGAETQRKCGAGKVLAALALLAAIGVGGMLYHQNQQRQRDEQARQKAESAATAKAATEKVEAERRAEEARKAEEVRKLEDARRKLEEEKRAIEAEKARMEKERAKPKTEDNPSDAGISIAEQEARRKEIAELAENRVDIAIKAENIADVMAKIAAYRNEPDGFAAHIANADAQRKIADGVGRSPATSAEAKAALKTLEDAERVIQREYNWLKTNKTARDEAKQIEAEIARDIVPVMERFKAGDYARVAYGKGDRLRKDGNAALSKGDFPAAKAKLSEAKKQLSAAAAEAKGFCIDTHLKTAKKWNDASKWQKCVEECDTILGWDAANAEAKKLKAATERHLDTTAKLVAKEEDLAGVKTNVFEFMPRQEVYEKLDEELIAKEKMAVLRLVNVKDAAPLEMFVNISIQRAEDAPWTYFKLHISPRVGLQIVPKDVIILIDVSGSIGAERLVSCRVGAKSLLRSVLNSDDRFNLIAFRDDYSYAFRSWQGCNRSSFLSADKWLDNLTTHGRGDIFGAIGSILTFPRDPERPLIAFVVTDGTINGGENAAAQMISKFANLNEGLAAVYVYCVNDCANGGLIDFITCGSRGESFVYDGVRWKAGSHMEQFFGRFRFPVLTDIRAVFAATSQAEVYPHVLRNIYRDVEMTIVGRVPGGAGGVAFSMEGLNGGKAYRAFFNIPLDGAEIDSNIIAEWAEENQKANFIARHSEDDNCSSYARE